MKKRVIALSGLPVSGSTTISKILAKKMGLDYFSPGQLFKDIAKGKLKEKKIYPTFKELCDKSNLTIPDFNEKDNSSAAYNLWNTDFGKNPRLHSIIDKLQTKLAEKGNIIIDGKLSIHMIKNADIKIWLKASEDARVSRSKMRDNITFEEAKKIIPEREKKEREEWKKLYGIDYITQETNANIIIDTSTKSPNAISEIILNRINNKL